MTQAQESPSVGSKLVRLPGQLLGGLFDFLIGIFDLIFSPLQSRLGLKNMAYLFLLPNMLIFGIFVLFPMLLNFYYAFTGGTKLYPQDRTYVGMKNFEILFDCQNFLQPNTCNEDIFWRAIYGTIFYVVFQVGFMVLFSLITALVLNRDIRGRGFFRSVYFYPVLLSPVVVALLWKWILQREGVLNAIITRFGGDPILFLLDPNWARFWVIAVSVWAQMGFFTLILLAGLQAIPADLYEAASIDGAGSSQSFRNITLPLLMPTMFVVLVLALIRAVQVFDQVYVLTGGGPGSTTRYLVQYIYETGFSNQIQRFGLAAAASMVMGAALLVLTLIQLRLGRQSGSA